MMDNESAPTPDTVGELYVRGPGRFSSDRKTLGSEEKCELAYSVLPLLNHD